MCNSNRRYDLAHVIDENMVMEEEGNEYHLVQHAPLVDENGTLREDIFAKITLDIDGVEQTVTITRENIRLEGDQLFIDMGDPQVVEIQL